MKDPWFRNHLIRDAIYRALLERMRSDPRVVLVGEGAHMKTWYDCRELHDQFKERILTTPICEDAAVNMSLGLAIGGLVPVVNCITADFCFRAMDSICNTVAKTAYCDQPRTIVIQAEFMTGGPTTGQRLEGLFARIPGLNVVVPSNPADAYGLMLTALQRPEATVFFEDRMIEDATTLPRDGNTKRLDYTYRQRPFGASLRKSGHDVTIVSYGLMQRNVEQLLWYKDKNEFDLKRFELIDLRTLWPLDVETVLRSVERTGRLLVVEPDIMFGGIGAELIAQVVAQGRPVRTERLGAPRATLPACRELHGRYVPSDNEILDAIESLLR